MNVFERLTGTSSFHTGSPRFSVGLSVYKLAFCTFLSFRCFVSTFCLFYLYNDFQSVFNKVVIH